MFLQVKARFPRTYHFLKKTYFFLFPLSKKIFEKFYQMEQEIVLLKKQNRELQQEFLNEQTHLLKTIESLKAQIVQLDKIVQKDLSLNYLHQFQLTSCLPLHENKD